MTEPRDTQRAIAAWLGGGAGPPGAEALERHLPPDLLPLAACRAWAPGSNGPSALRAQAQRALQANAALHLAHTSELRRALDALDARGIPGLALKGMALAHDVYPQAAARVMVDVDLGVPSERLGEARRVLEASGLAIPERRAADFARCGDRYEGPLERPGTSRMVDLHGSLKLAQPPYTHTVVKEPLVQAHWERARHIRVGEHMVSVLSVEDALRHSALHLACMHGFQHGVRSLVDIALLLGHHGAGLDWGALRERVGELAPWMALTLALAADDFGAELPPAARNVFALTEVNVEAARLAREQLWDSHRVHAPAGLLDLLVGRRSPLPGARTDDAQRVGGAAPPSGLPDLRRRLTVFSKTLRRGHLRPRELRRALGLRRGHWRLAELMRRDP